MNASQLRWRQNYQKVGKLSVVAGAVMLIMAVIIFAAEQISIATVNGWWADELYSFWSTDPSLPFLDAFSNRFGLDPTPPLYYAALYGIRALIHLPIGNERAVAIILNLLAIFIASTIVTIVSRRAKLTGFALAGIAVFLLSGPILTYTQEARSNLMAMAIVFVASWLAGLTIETPHLSYPRAPYYIVGVLAGMVHLYAALICGGLAAGLVIVAMFGRRRDLLLPGLALGLASSGTYTVWFLTAAGPATWHKQGWLKFTLRGLIGSGWHASQLAIGGCFGAIALLVLLSYCSRDRATSDLTAVFSISLLLFIALPILISFKTPIVTERYWLIGAPSLVVYLVFVAGLALRGISEHRSHSIPSAIGWGAITFLLFSSVTGFIVAYSKTENKFIWKGAEIVTPLLKHCPAASIHVLPVTTYIGEYAQMAHMSPTLFVDAESPATARLTLAKSSCPVLGWAEHVVDYGDVTHESDAELLRLVKIDAPPDSVDILRHKNGYVVLRRNR